MMLVFLHFRMKMDAVPGTPTTLWFTPIYTTEEMKKRTGNPDFVYEISLRPDVWKRTFYNAWSNCSGNTKRI